MKPEIKLDCVYCGCSKDKIQIKNSGPIIKIQCPECGYTIDRGFHNLYTLEAILKRWNEPIFLDDVEEPTKKEYEESAVNSAWNIIRYCKSIAPNCQECVFVKYTDYRKTFNRCPFNDGGKIPKEWKPPFLDIFDTVQDYTQL